MIIGAILKRKKERRVVEALGGHLTSTQARLRRRHLQVMARDLEPLFPLRWQDSRPLPEPQSLIMSLMDFIRLREASRQQLEVSEQEMARALSQVGSEQAHPR